MDGVLIDARDWHYRALNDALEIFGCAVPYNEHLERFNGLPTREKLGILSREGRLPEHLHSTVNAIKQERTIREAASLCFPRVEHLLLMSWLKRLDLRVGVATNSIRHTTTTMLQYAGVLENLDCLVTNEDVVSAKPAPDIYLEACRRLGAPPTQVLVVEDHEVGVRAAQAAGCTVVQVDGPDDVCIPLLEGFFR
jgi:beta-phosphoglucomutase-like phosphatase (HAD superfamily)